MANERAGSEVEKSPKKKRRVRKKRWVPPVWVWVLLAVYFGVVLWLQLADPTGDHSMSNGFSILVGLLAVVTLIFWFLFFSGHRWWIRLIPLLAAVAFVFVFNALFRLDHVSGALMPRFALRSAPKPDRLLEKPELAAETDRSMVDLRTTTPDDFPQFLGRDRNLAVEHLTLARDWDAQPPELLWRQTIGAGWSSFSVVNGYAVTMEQRGELEMVTCYDLDTGEMKWAHSIEARYETEMGGVGPRATPAIDDGWVYALGATGRLTALDGATGRLEWEKDLLQEYGMTPEEEARRLPYGRSGSPLVVGDLVVVPVGGPEGRRVSLVAYDKKTGEMAWEGGDRQISCSSPAVATLGGVEQILIVNEGTVSGHDVGNGRVLWECDWEGHSNSNASVSQAVPVPPNRVFLSKAYGVGGALVELVPRGDGTFEAERLWHSPRVMKTKFTNVVLHEGYVYGLSDGILESIELATGSRVWKGGRYGHGQILRVGDLLLVLAESGEMVLVEATPDRRNVLGDFQAVAGKTWNNFALYGPHLLVRNAEEAACYKLPLAG
ncbi:MAG: PQQ-binding-like beta-propeller repeat protein [bacterium]|nr:PQQ-binding-like beta-propeller repeat protein [bacterium]